MNNVKFYRGLSVTLSLLLALGHLPAAARAAEGAVYPASGYQQAENTLITIKGTDVTISGYSFPYTGDESARKSP